MGLTERQEGAATPRYAILDAIRGVAVLGMFLYHGAWDCVYLFGCDWSFYPSTASYLWQQSLCWTFILLSGFCRALGGARFRRALTVFLTGALISLVTLLFLPETPVLFGVLTLLGSCMLLSLPLDGLLRRYRPGPSLLLCLLLFALTRNVNRGYLGFEGLDLVALPGAWYRNLFTAGLGFPPDHFVSTDYFSLFPWLFLFLAGYFLCRLAGERDWLRLLTRCEGVALTPFLWAGQYPLLLYLLHQPLLYGFLFLFFRFLPQ